MAEGQPLLGLLRHSDIRLKAIYQTGNGISLEVTDLSGNNIPYCIFTAR